MIETILAVLIVILIWKGVAGFLAAAERGRQMREGLRYRDFPKPTPGEFNLPDTPEPEHEPVSGEDKWFNEQLEEFYERKAKKRERARSK